MTDHWCKYCNGRNAHNCQFNTNLPRVKIYSGWARPAATSETHARTAGGEGMKEHQSSTTRYECAAGKIERDEALLRDQEEDHEQ